MKKTDWGSPPDLEVHGLGHSPTEGLVCDGGTGYAEFTVKGRTYSTEEARQMLDAWDRYISSRSDGL